MDVLLWEPGDQILADDTVQGPALVTTSNLLSHSRQETLRIEETCDPKYLKSKEYLVTLFWKMFQKDSF